MTGEFAKILPFAHTLLPVFAGEETEPQKGKIFLGTSLSLKGLFHETVVLG